MVYTIERESWVAVGATPKPMKAAVFVAPGKIELREMPVPSIGPGDPLIKVTTTICGTDVHILKGEYPVRPGLIIGHEPVGVIVKLDPGVTGYEVGQRGFVGAITPCGQCHSCLDGQHSKRGSGTEHGFAHALGYIHPRRLKKPYIPAARIAITPSRAG